MSSEAPSCYSICNQKYKAYDPKRIFCKKGCDSDEDSLEACKNEHCNDLCIKAELGDEENKLGSWSKFFSRAPTNPGDCIDACNYGMH